MDRQGVAAAARRGQSLVSAAVKVFNKVPRLFKGAAYKGARPVHAIGFGTQSKNRVVAVFQQNMDQLLGICRSRHDAAAAVFLTGVNHRADAGSSETAWGDFVGGPNAVRAPCADWGVLLIACGPTCCLCERMGEERASCKPHCDTVGVGE